MLAIITGTICPSGDMKQLAICNAEERLEQYKKSLRFFIGSGAFSKIVFAENSNYGAKALEDLSDYARKNRVQLEILSFAGNTVQSILQGKGYGEGEIMQYVMEHSELLKGESFFVKITGRLLVHNIREITKKLKEQRTYFNIPNRTRKDIYDTRIYAMPVSQFREGFMSVYTQVMDDEGVYLERVYTRQIVNRGIMVYNFPSYPRIEGISGSGGTVYAYSEWKCKIRDMISRFNYYTIKKNRKR